MAETQQLYAGERVPDRRHSPIQRGEGGDVKEQQLLLRPLPIQGLHAEQMRWEGGRTGFQVVAVARG